MTMAYNMNIATDDNDNGSVDPSMKPKLSEEPRGLMTEQPTSSGQRTCWQEYKLIVFIALGLLCGIVLGSLLKGEIEPNDDITLLYLGFPGHIFLNILKCLILPLVVTSIISALANLGGRVSGRLGMWAVAYYMSTTFAAVVLGIVLVLALEPGANKKGKLDRFGSSKKVVPGVAMADLVSQAFPDNFVTAASYRVVREVEITEEVIDGKNKTVTSISKHFEHGINVLGFITLSITVGVAIGMSGDNCDSLRDFFEAANYLTLKITHAIIWLTPIGLASLVAVKFITTENLVEVGRNLGMYMLTVLLGIFIHGFVILPMIYWLMTRKSPSRFCYNMIEAIMTAWGTASSSATLPVTMECLVEKNHVELNIVRFVAPIGATVNMDGTALYEAVACIFIAQANNISLELPQIIVTALTATVAAIGAAGVPQAGLVTMVIVLTAVGLPTEDVTLILAVDWFLDRFRTVMNIWGDSIGAGILDHYFANEVNDNKSKSSDGLKSQSFVYVPLDALLDTPATGKGKTIALKSVQQVEENNTMTSHLAVNQGHLSVGHRHHSTRHGYHSVCMDIT